ncbi:MAG TPA: hypothetical protein VH475_26010 [Tepidisphaeraceae bacterium]
MRTTARRLLWAALILASVGTWSAGQDRRPAAPTAPAARAGDERPTPIPGLTDKLGLDQQQQRANELLGPMFESQTAGVSFRPPANCKPIVKSDPDNVVEYVNEEKHWLLKVTRARLTREMPLQTTRDKNGERIGLLDYTVQDILKEHPAAQVMRRDIINVGENGVGVIAVRLSVGNERFLRQQAIFQADEQLYYVFNLTTPAAKEGKPEDDPDERLSAETFKAMLDTIQLLDRSWIKTDQVNRLYRTRALFADWADKGGRRIRQAVVPEQWLRIIRDGKDIGYSYVAEEAIEAKDAKTTGRGFDGVLVSVRSRTIADGNQIDVGSQMFSSLDRKHEDWAHIVNTVLQKGKPAEEKRQTREFGNSEIKIRRVVDNEAGGGAAGAKDRNANDDPRNPRMREVETYALRVERLAMGRNANNLPETHTPSPWYIPQAIGSMMPRLLPLNRPVTYLFQSYVSDQHEVILRYVDVGYEKEVKLAGQTVRAIPITDRIRLEGSPTIHYMSPEGKYLGSVSEAARIVVLPSDKATLEKIWTNPDLRKQEEIARPTGTLGTAPGGGQ